MCMTVFAFFTYLLTYLQVEVPDVGAAVEAKKAEVKMRIEPCP